MNKNRIVNGGLYSDLLRSEKGVTNESIYGRFCLKLAMFF